MEKSRSWQLFDQIASTYDLANRVLSARQDVVWRKKIARHLPQKPQLDLLDLATGTGDQILHLLKVTSRIQSAVGIDLSEKMLEIGRKKIQDQGLSHQVKLLRQDACHLELQAESFDVVTMSFGIRNVPDVPACLSEMLRVLRPGGRALMIEFSLPNPFILRKAYLFYFRNVLPRLGGLLSGNTAAYRYLNTSAENFPYGEAFQSLMRKSGFQKVKALPLTFGIAHLYIGEKV